MNRMRMKLSSVVAALALVAVAAVAINTARGQAADEAGLTVGTYDPQQAFQQYPGREQLMAQMQQLQQQFMQAQQQNDTATAQNVQQQVQRLQQTAVRDFQQAVQKVMPKVAQEAGTQIIALQVAYKSPDVQVKDVTATVVEKLKAKGGGGAQPQQPNLPRQPAPQPDN